jgi:small subunit ribosomal protein S21
LNPKTIELKPIEVVVQDNDVGRALSALKRKMANEGLYRELKRRRFYEQPTVARKRKQREAERRRKKLLASK